MTSRVETAAGECFSSPIMIDMRYGSAEYPSSVCVMVVMQSTYNFKCT